MRVFHSKRQHFFIEVEPDRYVTTEFFKLEVVSIPAEDRRKLQMVEKPVAPLVVCEHWKHVVLSRTEEAMLWVEKILGKALTWGEHPSQLHKETEMATFLLNKDGTLHSVATSAKAVKTAKTENPELVAVEAQADLQDFNIKQLVAIHNAAAPSAGMAEVKGFKNGDTAVEKAFAALVEAYDPAVIKAREKAAAQAEREAAKAAKQAEREAAKAEKAAAKAEAGGGRGPRSTYAGKTIKVLNSEIKARADSWTEYMLQTIVDAGTVDEALATHSASGLFEGKRLDFAFAAAKGYVEYV